MKKLSVFPAILVIIACILMCSGCGNSEKTVKEDISSQTENNGDDSNAGLNAEEAGSMYIYCGSNRLEMEFADTVTADALIRELQKGDITVDMRDYGGFEKVGSLGKTYPADNSRITTQAGDVVLYSGNQIVIFYGSNTWSYTRIGKIKVGSVQEIKKFFGDGNVTITLSLN